MPMTVAGVVALPVVQQGLPEVLSAHGFDRVVRWVHVSDVADLSNLLQGGELVLTRGAALRRSPRRYLERLVSAQVVGVIVEVDPDGPALSPSVTRIAAQRDLALVVLHRQIKFVEVTEQVHRAIVAEQFEEVDFARRVHEIFTELSLQRAAARDIVEAAARLVDRPIVLENLAHQALVLAPAGQPAPELLDDWERRSRLAGRAGAVAWTVTPVGRGTEQWGRLIALGAAAGTDPPRVRMVLERAAQALAMQRMAERGRSDIEHRAAAGLIDDVQRRRIGKAEAAARAFALGLRPARCYTPAVVRARQWSAGSDPVADQQRNARLLDTVAQTTKAMGHSGLFCLRGPGEVGIVLSLSNSRGGAASHLLQRLGEAIRRDVRRESDAAEVVLGVAPVAGEPTEAITRLEEAAHVAEVAGSLPLGERTVFTAGDLRLRGLVSLLREDPRVQRYAESELRALLLHDIEKNDNCAEVLRGYLELAHNKTALAQRLHLSRPALYAKLRRIEEVLGVSLSDGESATSLHVALLALDAQSRPALSPP